MLIVFQTAHFEGASLSVGTRSDESPFPKINTGRTRRKRVE